MLMIIYYIWIYCAAYVYSQIIIENFELIEREAQWIKFNWKINNSTALVDGSIIKCSRFDGREETSTSISSTTGTVTINNLAPNTKYKCKLEVHFASGSEFSEFVSAETLIGDACIQPVGFETGIIKEDNIIGFSSTNSKKKSIRLYDADGFWCSESSPYIKIDLGRIMTITGLLFRTSNTNVGKIYLKYGIQNDMQDICNEGLTKRTFDYPKNGTTRYWLSKTSFTVKLLEFISMDSKTPFCLQVEVYGCSEICSSKLNPLFVYHILQWNTSLSNRLTIYDNATLTCIEVTQSLQFDFGKHLTLSGFMMLSKNVSVNISIRYGNNNENTILENEVSQTFSTNFVPHSYTTFWFNKQILTRYIEVRSVSEITCMQVVFLGCNSANMNKLGIENASTDISLTESSAYGLNHRAIYGRLNAMKSDWTSATTDTNPWYQICFEVIQTVSAIAIQGIGYYNTAYITEYIIVYGYSANTVLYNYLINGSPYRFNGTKNRYVTSVSEFPVEISAQCLRITEIKFFQSASGRFEVLGNKKSFPPNVTIPKNVFNIKNSTAIVKCIVIGQPGLLIQWRKQNKIVVDDRVNYFIQTSNRSLDVNGTYTSELEITPLVHVNVDNDDTYCHGDKKNVSCFFYYSVMTGYTLSSLFETNVTFMHYGFDAEVDLPNLTIIATNITINIVWTIESIKRDFQVFYKILLIEYDGSSNITLDNKTVNENIVIYNSKPYTFYTFQLTAINRLGISQNVAKNFLSEEGYPSVIQNLTALATSKDNISLSWYPPQYQNGIITKYTVEYTELNSSSKAMTFLVFKEHLENQIFSFVFGLLKNYQTYKFRVNALTNQGKNAGEWSEWIEQTTLEGNPSIVRNLTASAISKEIITLKWQDPEIKNGIITNYTVEYGEFNSTHIASLSFSVFKSYIDTHIFSIETLKNYQKYKFRVNAFTNHGLNPGEWSEWIEETTFEGNPSVVRNLTASALSKEDIELKWCHPEIHNGIITNYTVEYRDFFLSKVTLLSFCVFNSHFDTQTFAVQVNQLKNYQKYVFRVNALTNHGLNPGEWSKWVEETTFEGIPSFPENLVGNAKSSRDVLLGWTEPRQQNGIVRNYIIAYSGFKFYNSSFKHKGELIVKLTQVNISSLFPGTTYIIYVNAQTTVKGPSSSINITLPFDEPIAPLLKFENQKSEKRKIVLCSVPSSTGPISHYEFDIQENSNYCLNNSTTLKILSTLGDNELVIPKGEENITLQTTHIQLSLIGKFLICYRAVVNDSGVLYVGAFSHMDLERNDLAKIKKEEIKIAFNTVSLILSKGPLSTKYYQIIVFKGYPNNKDPSPSELSPYNEKNDIYLAAEFNASEFMYYQNFTVGDGKTYRRSRVAYSNFYSNSYDFLQNVELQDGKNYSILQRAYEHKTKYYSTPWLVNIRTDKKPIIPETTLMPSLKKDGTSVIIIGAVSGIAMCLIIVLAVFRISAKRNQTRGTKTKRKNRKESTQLVPLKPVSAHQNLSLIVDENIDKGKLLEKPYDISYDDISEATRAVLNKDIYNYSDTGEVTKAVLNTEIAAIEEAVIKFKFKMENVVGNILHLQQPWFHGVIPRTEAERRLKSVIETGMFLIRERGSPRGSYVICLCYQGSVYHYLFESNNHGQLSINSGGNIGRCFDNLMAVVSYYTQNSDGLFCTLKKACEVSWFEFQPKTELHKNILLHPEIQAELKKTLLLFEDELKKYRGVSKDERPSLDQSRMISRVPNQSDIKETWTYENIYDCKKIVGTEGFRNPFQAQERETELDPQRLRLEHELGHGNFGSVVKGVYMLKNNKSIAVAVKTLKEEDIPGQKSEIVKEADIMAKLDHPNIVRLVGITQSPRFMLVMELAPQGPLHKFLKKNKNMNVLDILVLMLQVDEGMNYLESQHFVHRDLAARNVLVVSNIFVKISDFGMSRAMGAGNEYYRAERAGKWPLKWYALECIYYHKFSSKGDVWSYGITMWEAVSYGGVPYQGMKGPAIVEKLESGYRLPKPDNCPDAIYMMMSTCWETNPDDRPSFMEIGIILSQYIQDERIKKKY